MGNAPQGKRHAVRKNSNWADMAELNESKQKRDKREEKARNRRKNRRMIKQQAQQFVGNLLNTIDHATEKSKMNPTNGSNGMNITSTSNDIEIKSKNNDNQENKTIIGERKSTRIRKPFNKYNDFVMHPIYIHSSALSTSHTNGTINSTTTSAPVHTIGNAIGNAIGNENINASENMDRGANLSVNDNVKMIDNTPMITRSGHEKQNQINIVNTVDVLREVSKDSLDTKTYNRSQIRQMEREFDELPNKRRRKLSNSRSISNSSLSSSAMDQKSSLNLNQAEMKIETKNPNVIDLVDIKDSDELELYEAFRLIHLSSKFFPKEHQLEGTRFMLESETKYKGSILSDEMGLGKTLQMNLLCRFSRLRQETISNIKQQTLIVAPFAVAPQCVIESLKYFTSDSRPTIARFRGGKLGWYVYTYGNMTQYMEVKNMTPEMLQKMDLVITHHDALTQAYKVCMRLAHKGILKFDEDVQEDKVDVEMQDVEKEKENAKEEKKEEKEKLKEKHNGLGGGEGQRGKKRKYLDPSRDSDNDTDNDSDDEDEKQLKKYGNYILLMKHKYHRVIIDEAHKMRNPTTIFAKACFELNAIYRLCVTGTPKINFDSDTWSLFFFLRIPNLVSFREFKKMTNQPSYLKLKKIESESKALHTTSLTKQQDLILALKLEYGGDLGQEIDNELNQAISTNYQYSDSEIKHDGLRLPANVDNVVSIDNVDKVDKVDKVDNVDNVVSVGNVNVENTINNTKGLGGIDPPNYIENLYKIHMHCVTKQDIRDQELEKVLKIQSENPTMLLPDWCVPRIYRDEEMIVPPSRTLPIGVYQQEIVLTPGPAFKIMYDMIANYGKGLSLDPLVPPFNLLLESSEVSPGPIETQFGPTHDINSTTHPGNSSSIVAKKKRRNNFGQFVDGDGNTSSDIDDVKNLDQSNGVMGVRGARKDPPNRAFILSSLTFLRQLAVSPQTLLFDQAHHSKFLAICGSEVIQNAMNEKSCKIEGLTKYIEESVASHERVLIFCEFIKGCEVIEDALISMGKRVIRVDGKHFAGNREAAIRSFQKPDLEENEYEILISTFCLKVGITLTGANHVIFVTPWWHEALEKQAWSRVHRFGQGRDVHVAYLLIDNTVDLKVRRISKGKIGIPSTKQLLLLL